MNLKTEHYQQKQNIIKKYRILKEKISLKAFQNIVAIFKINIIDFRFLFLYVGLLGFGVAYQFHVLSPILSRLIYSNKFKTNLIISNNTYPSKLLDRTNTICSNVHWKTVSIENNVYIGLTTTLSRLTMHLNDSTSIALHLKTHSIPKTKFRKILVENSSTRN